LRQWEEVGEVKKMHIRVTCIVRYIMNIDGSWVSIDLTMGMGNDKDNVVDPQND